MKKVVEEISFLKLTDFLRYIAGFITGGNDLKAIRRFSNKLTTVDKHHVFGAVSFHEINFKNRTNYLEAFLNDA